MTDGEASQVVGPLTPGQQLNVRIVNALDFFLTFFRKEVAYLKLPAVAQTPLEEPLGAIEALMNAAVQPLLQSISDALEAILITAHHEDFSQELGPGEEAPPAGERPSLYMQELAEFVQRVRQQYLSQFLAEEFIFGALRPHVARTIDVFLIQASLVRRIGRERKKAQGENNKFKSSFLRFARWAHAAPSGWHLIAPSWRLLWRPSVLVWLTLDRPIAACAPFDHCSSKCDRFL